MARTIAMMQPYLFPYLGYFQLIAAADVFVLGDDLQFIRAGWVNRNRILSNGQARLITFPLKKDHFELPIMQRQLIEGFPDEAARIINLIRQNYRKAPFFAEVMPLLEGLIRFPQLNLARYAEHSLRELCAYLQISTPILRGSDIALESCTDKQDRVIRIAHALSATTVLNSIGGLELYDRDHFARNGLLLRFFKMDTIEYQQFAHPFVPHLSIIDVLMFNSVERIQELLTFCNANEGAAANDAFMRVKTDQVTTYLPHLAVE
ncbi:hypothetical protein EGJ27_18380 [Pseudomonas sp. v388]|uniref:WbqC family protein n=1 Tax=Pseudomonas sp. v388 TaxID=2479849 RepID=UPI000F79D428|nr:WbqC family protein [Pseudomonas sp. v388]RRV05775.1 hypothetical protein EGJ27_18380 [Pseudomonas sp. v388]